jgi:predicted nucleic-acid-binding protein
MPESGTRAIDANVLVRLITRDDERQVAAAESFIEPGAWISFLALAEAVWVLDSVFERSPAEQARAVEMLLSYERLVVQNPETIAEALQLFRHNSAENWTRFNSFSDTYPSRQRSNI